MEQNGYAVDYGDAYMEQEEEWEREGLLDPAWEKQQKKVNNQSVFSVHYFSEYFFFVIIVSVNWQWVIWTKSESTMNKIFFFWWNCICVSVTCEDFPDLDYVKLPFPWERRNKRTVCGSNFLWCKLSKWFYFLQSTPILSSIYISNESDESKKPTKNYVEK